MKQYDWKQADGSNLLVETDFKETGYIRVFRESELISSWENLSLYVFEMIESNFLDQICDLRV